VKILLDKDNVKRLLVELSDEIFYNASDDEYDALMRDFNNFKALVDETKNK